MMLGWKWSPLRAERHPAMCLSRSPAQPWLPSHAFIICSKPCGTLQSPTLTMHALGEHTDVSPGMFIRYFIIIHAKQSQLPLFFVGK